MSHVLTADELDSLQAPTLTADDLDSLQAPTPPERPYVPPTGPGQRGQPPRTPRPELARRGAPPPIPAQPIPAPKTPPEDESQSLIDPLLDLVAPLKDVPLTGIAAQLRRGLDTPEGQALADTARGLATKENVGIMTGLAGANLLPGVGTAVKIGAAGYFGHQMLESGIKAEADLQAAQAAAAAARARGDEAAAKQFDDKARYARAQKYISSSFVALIGAHGAKEATEAATAHITPDRELPPEEVKARVKADLGQKPQVMSEADLDNLKPVEVPPDIHAEIARLKAENDKLRGEPLSQADLDSLKAPEPGESAPPTPAPTPENVTTGQPEAENAPPEAPPVENETKPPESETEPPVPETKPTIPETEPPKAETPPPSNLQSFRSDKDAITTHAARGDIMQFHATTLPFEEFTGKLQDAAEQASDAVLEDYLAKLRAAAETHAPAAMDAVDRADQALEAGNKRAFALDAEEARSELSTAYQNAVADAQLRKMGVEPPDRTGQPTKGTEFAANRGFERLLQQATDSHLTSVADAFESADTDLVGKTVGRDPAQSANYDTEQVRRVGGGYKDEFPFLKDIPEAPGLIAKAIRKGKGVLFERLHEATENWLRENHSDDIRQSMREPEPVQDEDESFNFGANAVDPPVLDLPTGEPNFGERMDRTIEEAKQRMRDRGKKGPLGSEAGKSPILDDLNDLITIGAAHLAKGVVEFKDWSERMIKDAGERVRPHLQRLYQLSQESLAKSRPPQIESVEAAAEKYGVLGGVRRSMADAYRKVRDYLTIDPIPNLSRAGVQEEAVNHAYARIAVPRMINDLLSKVFPEDYKNPEVMAKTMRVMVMDNILGGYDDFKARAARAAAEGDTGGAKRFEKLAAAIEAKHDLGSYHEQVMEAKGDDKIGPAIQRWKDIVNPVMDQLYNEMKGMDPETPRDGRGRVFGARVNLLASDHVPGWLKAAVDDEAPLPPNPTPPLASYRNPNVRLDRFDRSAKFSAAEYSDDPVAVLASALFPRWNEVTKRRLYNKLVKNGWASWERPESGSIHGQEVRGAPVDIPETKTPQASEVEADNAADIATGRTKIARHVLWLPKDLHGEFRGVLGTDLPLRPSVVSSFLTKLQLAQLADATSHLKNIHSVIANAQGTRGLLADVGRKMPGVSSVDSFARIGKVMYDIAQNGPDIRAEIAEMAKQGMIRQHFPATGIQRITHMQDLIHSVDTASRVVMNRFYSNLVDRGLAADNFDSRRSFVQQIGEYNKRLMGPLMRAASQSGLSPFIVAGRTFNRFSRRLLTGEPGFTPTSTAAMIQSRLVNFTTLGSMFVLPAILNKLNTGTIMGRPGTPIGAIDLGGKPDARGNHKILDLLQLYGVRRGMRATGIESIAEGLQNGDSANDIVGKGIYDSVSTGAHPWLGPALGFATQATTGQRLDLRGGPMPEQASKMEGKGSQLIENMRVAAKNQNLLLYSPLRKAFSDVEESPGKDFAKDFLKAPAGAIGIGDRPSPAIQTARDLATHIQTTPAQKERSQARRQLLAAYDAKNTALAESLITQGQAGKLLSPEDVREIKRERNMSPIQRAVWREPIETVLQVWAKATPEEKAVLRGVLRTKLDNEKSVTPYTARARAIVNSR